MTSVKYFDSEMPGASMLSGGTAGGLISVLDECLVTGRGLVPCTINVTSAVATATIAGGHVFQTGVVAAVAGASVSAINGEKRITATTVNTVVFPAPGVADGAVSGTITIKLAPAGWTKAFWATSKAAYRSSDPSASGGYARVDDSGAGSTRYARLIGYDSMTDVDTGLNPNPTNSVVAGGWAVFKSNVVDATPRKWIVVADSKRVLVLVAHHSNQLGDYMVAGWGDLVSDKSGDAYPFLTFGALDAAQVVSAPAGTESLFTAGSTACSLARPYAQVGASVQARTLIPGAINAVSGHESNPVGPSVVNNALYVCPILLQEGVATSAPVRGRWPGLYHLPHAVGNAFDSKALVTGVDGLVGRSLMGVRFGTAVASVVGRRCMIDVTGPWD